MLVKRLFLHEWTKLLIGLLRLQISENETFKYVTRDETFVTTGEIEIKLRHLQFESRDHLETEIQVTIFVLR